MEILDRLSEYIRCEQLCDPQDRLLLGVSGGKDSMLMAFLLWKLGYQIAIAHCNFQLRDAESDLDEQLVRQFAEERGIPFYHISFETQRYAEEQQLSIQMSARALRYQWFEELRTAHDFAAIAVAHHQQDHIETVFINLARGTGLRGLRGIAPKRDRIIRPILWMSHEEIVQTVAQYHVPYRDDQSNFSNKYTRNKVRLDILPQFRALQPQFDQVMLENIERFTDSYNLLQRLTDTIRQQLFIAAVNRTEIDKNSLLTYVKDIPLLYELFRPYHFEKNILADLANTDLSHIGSRFESDSHVIVVDRTQVFLYDKNLVPLETYELQQDDTKVHIAARTLSLSISIDTSLNLARNVAKVDFANLVFPLTVRSWSQGDRFMPLGMNASKKISDFFIQKKIPLLEKDQIPLLVNGNGEIIWVVGYQLDNRYRIKENTKKVATFVYS
ncbi:tRNA lysidine(34) synthetase TilS [Sphingobacterium corticibacter]|uniref:tRNA(Ile)-lysidine synthase n=1 Tax=Sphingobacterium corticibacter TaxID=2171749 RepID=A0A2T8HKY3_9SPHI|nr:tRNA lysidine(34) synthetase TilS [Sphingobacterium corticibacter]PVH26106.1 tRNA lysidine(34) synthetase TilS [Sphingobacterium corticibacter]